MKDFNDNIEKIKRLSDVAYAYLERIPLETSHAFNEDIKYDLLLNNIVKTFNYYNLKARDKPMITMMETIRKISMKRFHKKCYKYEQLQWFVLSQDNEKA